MQDPSNPSQTKSSNPKDVAAAGESRCPLAYIPSPGLIHTAQAMADGGRKYGPYNWRKEGVGAMTYVSAAERHIRAWLDGEEDAADSKCHHLGHAAACLMILMDAQAVGNLVDDRPLPAPTAEMLEEIKAGRDESLTWVPRGEHPVEAAPVVVPEDVRCGRYGCIRHARYLYHVGLRPYFTCGECPSPADPSADYNQATDEELRLAAAVRAEGHSSYHRGGCV